MWFALEAYSPEKPGREFDEQYEHDENDDLPGENQRIGG